MKRVLGTAAIAATLVTGAASTASASGGPTGGGGTLYAKYLSYSDCDRAGRTLTQYPYHWTDYSCAYDAGGNGHGPTYDLWLA